MKANILKFGGSSFLHPIDYNRISSHIVGRLAAGARKIVVVVSAMSGTTDNLKTMILDVNNRASPSNLDAALATGEMLSTCLLEAAISQAGIRVTSMCGHTLGIRTNSDFGHASIEHVDPEPLLTALQRNDVVIAAGAQAIDQSGRLTTLGRNSSDLTAVVIASMLGCEECEIYSDVPGVFTADPYCIPVAKLIPEIAYGAIRQMSRHGAKVLHYGAVRYAELHGVTIICKSLRNDEETIGTRVCRDGQYANSVVVARGATLLHFANAAERDQACSILEPLDVSGMPADQNGIACICLTSDADFAVQQLRSAGSLPIFQESSTVITEFTGNAPRVYVESDDDSAIALARHIHDRLFPDRAHDV
ncbi:MAG: uridylate kinase [Mesorhizobium sp.]|uniref:amino acid kinase family protein n=1 Tax=Mesorhizobium sp. TaxID=1871066 RepID=UPI000FE6D6B1|nr:uridylate kinase [Mesorhizobium sp.]RWB36589.1 MAG: uridylate kinase [Mesorhizobium sp.]